jgi:hypothetical protein
MHMHMHMHMYMCNMYSNSWHPLPPGFVLLMLLWFDPKCHCFARHDRQPSRGPSCPTVTCSAIVLTCDFAGNADECYWGLPSIQRGDPAFPPLGYWRGYVWGPMAQLVYWSLQVS